MKTSGLFSNGAWAVLNQIVRVGSIALITIALSRHLGPQSFGSLAVGLALVRIFAVVASFGLDRIVVRHLVDRHDQGGDIVRDVFGLKLGFALLSYVAMLGLIFTFERADTLVLWIAVLAGAGLLFQAFDVFDYAFQAQGRFRFSFLGRGVPILLTTAVKFAAILLNAPLLVFAGLETVEAAIIGAALVLIYRRTIRRRSMSILPGSIARRRLSSGRDLRRRGPDFRGVCASSGRIDAGAFSGFGSVAPVGRRLLQTEIRTLVSGRGCRGARVFANSRVWRACSSRFSLRRELSACGQCSRRSWMDDSLHLYRHYTERLRRDRRINLVCDL